MSIFKEQGNPTEIKRSREAKWLCMPEDNLKESVKAAESMTTRWQIIWIRKKRMAAERPMETKQWNSKESVLNAMRSATRPQIALIKGRIMMEADTMILQKLPW
jgi:hypothetical protein